MSHPGVSIPFKSMVLRPPVPGWRAPDLPRSEHRGILAIRRAVARSPMRANSTECVGRSFLLVAASVLIVLVQVGVVRADEQCIALENERLIRECLGNAYAASAHELAEAVAHADSGTNAEHKRYLDASQAAWVHYRDAECTFEGDAYRAGTLESDQATLCVISKNKERVVELGNDIGLAAH